MSDSAAVNAAPASEAPAAPAEVAAPVAEVPVSTPISEPDDYSDLAGLDPKWAKEVRDLRKESANRRVALKPYEEAFSPYSEEERAVWFGLAQQVVNDPMAGVARLNELAQHLKEAYEADNPPEVPDPEGEKPLTKAEMEKYWADKQKESEVNAAAAQIEAKATAAGFKVGSKEYKLLLTRAMEMNYDLDAAIADQKAEIQLKAEELIAAKIASGEKWPITPSTGTSGSGSPSGEVQHDGSWETAEKSMRARIAAKLGK